MFWQFNVDCPIQDDKIKNAEYKIICSENHDFNEIKNIETDKPKCKENSDLNKHFTIHWSS